MGISKKPVSDSRRLWGCFSSLPLFFLKLYLFIYFIFSSCFYLALTCRVFYFLNLKKIKKSVEKFRNLANFFYEIKIRENCDFKGFVLPFF
jgi:hypothetical protein